MSSPKDVRPVGSDTSVEWVLWLGGSEWRVLSDHDEKNNGSGEKIYRFSLVWLIKMDFWGHVIQGSQFSGEIA